MSRIEQSAKGRERWISVGTTPWLAANVLPPAIKQFRERRTDLRIRLFDGWLDEIQQRVQAGKLDMGCRDFQEFLWSEEEPILPLCAHGRLSRSRGCDQQRSDSVVISERAEIDLLDDGLSASGGYR
jgi:DNA-binding transcriptional LysR family regulator